MNAKPTMVRLSEETRQRIKALVGTYGMAIFIRDAIEAKLSEEEGRPPPHTELKRRERKKPDGKG